MSGLAFEIQIRWKELMMKIDIEIEDLDQISPKKGTEQDKQLGTGVNNGGLN